MLAAESSEFHTTYVVNPAVAHREIEGQLLLLLPGEFDLFTLNTTGSMVWRDLVAGRSLDETARAIATRFGISETQAQGDVDRLVTELLAKEIISLR